MENGGPFITSAQQNVKFIYNLLKEHYTPLKFDDFTSDKIALDNGIRQGDPLTMILYQFYNANLLDIQMGVNEAASAYVVDVILVATAKDFEKTHEILEDKMMREGGAVDWSNKHNSKFEFSKLAVIDFCAQEQQEATTKLHTTQCHARTSAEHKIPWHNYGSTPGLEHTHCTHLEEGS